MRLPTRVAGSTVAERTALRLGLLVALRLLLVIGLVVLGYRALADPHDRPLADLQQSLAQGQVDSITLDAPLQGPGVGLKVRWSTGPLHSYIAPYSIPFGGPNPVREAVAESPRQPRVTVVHDPFSVDPRMRAGLGLGFLVGMGVLILLLSGPVPRLATRWAWFWLCVFLPFTAALFLVLEAAPLWRPLSPLPVRRTLTGWPALLGALVVAAVGRHLVPSLTGVLWDRG